MNQCTYCEANAIYRDRENGAYLCLAHTRLEVTGPRGPAPRPPLTLRPATEADREQIAQLAEYFWNESQVECFGNSYQVEELPAYVTYDGEELVGVASYALEGDTINLVMLGVVPRWQGQGIANRLIQAVMDVGRSEQASRMIVATTNDDLPALGLYQRLGFLITDILVGKMVEHHGGEELGFATIPVRDEIHLEIQL